MKYGRLILIVVAGLLLAGLWSWGGILLLAKYKRESRIVLEYEQLTFRYPLPAEGYKVCLKVLGSNPRPGGLHFVPVYSEYEVVLYWDALAAGGRGQWKLAPEVLRIKPPKFNEGVPIDEKTALALGQYHAETYFQRHPEKTARLLQQVPHVTREEKDGSWQVAYQYVEKGVAVCPLPSESEPLAASSGAEEGRGKESSTNSSAETGTSKPEVVFRLKPTGGLMDMVEYEENVDAP